MSLKVLPPHVRAHLYLFRVGMVASGLGVVGFFLSFWQVGSARQAAIDVHTDVPVLAYASILAWVGGLLVMWYSRRTLDAAVAARLEENRTAMLAEPGPSPSHEECADVTVTADPDAPGGRDVVKEERDGTL